MSEKSKLFDRFLVDEKLDCFDVHSLDDEDDTTLYRSYVQTDIGDMPIFVILDKSIYSIVRLVVAPGAVPAGGTEALHAFINRENSNFKSFKYYIEEEDRTLYLDCVYMCGDSCFEPQLLYVLMNQIVKYIPGITAEIKSILAIDHLPDSAEVHEQHAH